MTCVKPYPGESIDSLLRRFKKAVDDSGVLADLRKKEKFEKPSVQRKNKKAAAIKRERKRAALAKPKVKNANWKWNKDRTAKIQLDKPKKFISKPTYVKTGR